jgi:signal peptidase I
METTTATVLEPTQAPPRTAAPARVRRRRVRAALRRVGPQRAAILAALCAAGFGLGYLGTWPPVATVMSASMAPSIETGDVVVLKRLGGAPRPGDVIAVSVPDEARSRFGYPPTVVHRVVRVAPDGRLTTRGDARDHVDPFTVPGTAVQARVAFTIPAAGRAFAFLSSPMGLFWLAAGAVLLVGLPLFERQRESQQAEQDALAALHEELRRVHEEVAMLRSSQFAPEPPQVVRRRRGGLVGRLARRRP